MSEGHGGVSRTAIPVLLAVDDDARVLRAVAADLRSRYAPSYRIVRAESGESALEALRELKLRGGRRGPRAVRPAHARHGRRRAAGQGARALPRHQGGAAHRLRRH